MNMNVKICGLSTTEAVIAARDGGASHLGFIFFPKSPRHVTFENAASLAALSGHAQTVAVTVDADDRLLDEIVATVKPSMLQMHGSESVSRLSKIKARYDLPVLKAVAVSQAQDIARAQTYDGMADILLLDAKPPQNSHLPGGNGTSFDWRLLDNLETTSPVLLSGGLNIDNIEQAKKIAARADNTIAGFDVSSGVESAPGVKNNTKIQTFLAACGV